MTRHLLLVILVLDVGVEAKGNIPLGEGKV
jgi:hypothetical protein